MSRDSDRELAEGCRRYIYKRLLGRIPTTMEDAEVDAHLLAKFEAIRSETLNECAAACLVQIKRESGYHGQWEGYGSWMGDMTGPECSAVILALDKR